MNHEKYLAYAEAGMPLDEILTRFERDLLAAQLDAENDVLAECDDYGYLQ